jgi:hypothetical protein
MSQNSEPITMSAYHGVAENVAVSAKPKQKRIRKQPGAPATVPVIEPTMDAMKTQLLEEVEKEALHQPVLEELRNAVEKEIAQFAENQEKHVLGHLGDYVEEPFTLIESYFTPQY